THRYRRELPVIRHLMRVRIRRDADGRVRLLLTEAIEVVLRQTALEERPSVNTGGGVTLNEDLVATARVVCTVEEVVETHFVQRRRRGISRDVSTDTDAGALRAVHRNCGV